MRPWLVLAALLLSSAGAAADGPELLPPWVVSETPLGPDSTPVRATSLLTDEAWSGRAVGTLSEALNQIPGAILQESWGGFEPPRISIRGSGIQSAPSSRGVELLFDQFPLGLADGSFNSSLLDPLLSERIEVQRGIDGWRASPAEAGGELDFQRVPTLENAAALRFEAGSFGALRASGSESLVRGDTSETSALSDSQQDGYRNHSGQARTAFLASLAHSFAADSHADFEVYHANSRYDVPGPLTLAAAMEAPGSVSSAILRDLPDRASEITRVSGSFACATPDWDFEAGASFAHTTDDFRQLQPNGVTESSSDDADLRAAFARRFNNGTSPDELRLTATVDRGWRDLQRLLNNYGQTGAEFAHDGLFPTTADLQLEDTFTIASGLVGTVGVARTQATRDIEDRSGVHASTTRDLSSGSTLPAASLRWRFSGEDVAFASVSATSEAPTFDDLLVTTGSYPSLGSQSQALDAQRTVTVEIGARGRTGPLAWDAAVYHGAWQNEILSLADQNGNPRGSVNASPTEHDGIETSFRWLLLERRSVRVSLTGTAAWTHFVFDDDPVYGTNRLAGNPPHIGTAELLVDSPNGGFLAAGSDWTAGATPVDHANKLVYGGQALSHVRGGWRFAPYWTLFAEVQNLFNRTTIASTAGVLDLARNPGATALFLPAPGRAFVAGVQWKR
jgi:iron complex outermembrane receptor protein